MRGLLAEKVCSDDRRILKRRYLSTNEISPFQIIWRHRVHTSDIPGPPWVAFNGNTAI